MGNESSARQGGREVRRGVSIPLTVLAVGVAALIGVPPSRAQNPPPNTVPQTLDEKLRTADSLGRLRTNSQHWPVNVEPTVGSFTHPIIIDICCRDIPPAQRKVEEVNIRIQSHFVSFASGRTRDPSAGGWLEWYLSYSDIEMQGGERHKILRFDNALALNPLNVVEDDGTWARRLQSETLLYHELLHSQLLVDKMQTPEWRLQVCNCQTDLSAADIEHKVIPGHEDAYLAGAVGTAGGQVYDGIQASADGSGSFTIDVGPVKASYSIEYFCPYDGGNIQTVHISHEGGRLILTGQLIDPSQVGKFYGLVDPPGSLTLLGLETPATVNPSMVSYWLQVASHAGGANQSQWRTDLGLLNAGSQAAAAQLRFHAPSGTLTKDQAVAAGQQLILADVVGGFAGSPSGSAALQVMTDQPLIVSSRTYNLVGSSAACFPDGTFGQNLDGFAPQEGMSAGDAAWLPQLTEDDAYRTNIALTNTGTAPATVDVTLYDGAGAQVGSYTVNLAAGEYKQENQPFKTKAGQTSLSRGYAKVEVTAGSGILAMASVVDNVSNDPTTMPMCDAATAAAQDCWFQVASHASGANQSQWRTDLGVLNPGSSSASVDIRFHKAGGTTSNTVAVAAGQQAILADVVAQIPDSGSAALEVVADQSVVASSRTYSLLAASASCYPNGTFGQNLDAFTSQSALQQGQVAYLPQLQENADYRTNIALTNVGTTVAAVTVDLFDSSGQLLATYSVNLTAGEYKQENRPYQSKAGQTNLAAGYARVTVTQGSGIIAVGSVVDNRTNDPTTVPAMQ